MPAYGEKQQPAGIPIKVVELPLKSRKGAITKDLPYKGNAVLNANRK